jgi:flagellar motor switch protein FliN
MINKRDLALETSAELFLTAFNEKVFAHGALKRVATPDRVDPNLRWFRQPFICRTNFELFVGISAGAADALPDPLTDLLKNALRGMARALESVAHSTVSCDPLTEQAPPPRLATIAYELRREAILFGAVSLAIPESLINFLTGVLPDAAVPPEPAMRNPSLHLDALMNVDLPVSISFGSTEMPLADVLRLTTGSIVEFNHLLNEPVNVVVNDCLVARGDVVVVDGNYGIRISEVLTQAQR